MAAPPPPTIIYLEPPVAVFVGSLYAIEGVRPLFAAPLLCERSPCAVREGMVVSTDGLTGVVVEARRGVALPWVGR